MILQSFQYTFLISQIINCFIYLRVLLYLYINLFMRIIMDIIKFNTTLKASGKDYFKIVFWNRFIRNPIELILSWLPAVISLVLLCLHYYSSFLLILYAVCWFYPIYIFGYQFRSSVNYHLKHRDPSEEAPCTITLMNNAIMADIPEHNLVYTYEWNQFTNVYNKFGYYMLFNK